MRELDAAWAAGIYEGEGTIYQYPSNNRTRVEISQKDWWLPFRLRELFGGRIYYIEPRGRAAIYRWELSGKKARQFIRTIYPMLSPRRQEQVDTALSKWRDVKNDELDVLTRLAREDGDVR